MSAFRACLKDVSGPLLLAAVSYLLSQEAPLPQSTWVHHGSTSIYPVYPVASLSRISKHLPVGRLLMEEETSVESTGPPPPHHEPVGMVDEPRLSHHNDLGEETVAGVTAQRSFVQEVVAIAVSSMAAVGAFVAAAVRGKGTTVVTSEASNSEATLAAKEVDNYAAYNLLWFTLTSLLFVLGAGLLREVYLGPLRPFIIHDALVSVFAVVSGVLWVRMFRTLASEGIIERKLSRKLIHITSAPLFLLCWPLYSDTVTARCVAAIPPLANAIRLLNAGLGKAENQDAVQAISRQGGRKELLQGPLYYVLVLLTATALGWRSSLASYVSICLMAGGDGLADIVGRRFGKVKLPWNSSKSWAGSIAMAIGGFVMSTAFVFLFSYAGYLPAITATDFVLRLGAVCLITTAVESLPTTESWPLDDNVSVPLVAMVCSALLFHTF